MSEQDQNLTHLDDQGRARMVDVSAKAVTVRTAVARARLTMAPATLEKLLAHSLPKGDAQAVARLAGILAAKRVPDLIPLCHPVALTEVSVDFARSGEDGLEITARARARDVTGVEMEALTAAAVAALAVYDMGKAVDKGMVIGPVELLEKTGGKSGDYRRE